LTKNGISLFGEFTSGASLVEYKKHSDVDSLRLSHEDAATHRLLACDYCTCKGTKTPQRRWTREPATHPLQTRSVEKTPVSQRRGDDVTPGRPSFMFRYCMTQSSIRCYDVCKMSRQSISYLRRNFSFSLIRYSE
jgi:hypothetical protein